MSQPIAARLFACEARPGAFALAVRSFDMGSREVDWSTAEVSEEGTLTVGLAGEHDKHWCEAFTTVAALLDVASHNHLWGEVVARSTKGGDQIIVKELQTEDPEHVERLREFLGAVARQAGANVPEPDATDGDDVDSPAARSTRAFRALAEDPER
jgi:hypothetical protein